MAGMKTKPRWYIVLLACLALLSVYLFISCRPAPPAIILFSATPSEIDSGQSTTLKWDIKDAASVTIDQGIGEVDATGSVELSPAKIIAYTLTATNAGGTVSKSVVIYVNPPPPPPTDTTPPVIKNVSASSETETGAVITWATNEPGSSQIEYGKTTEYGLTATSDELATAHSITLSGLEPNTDYHYRVKSKDKAGNEASSTDYSFATAVPKSEYSLELQSLEWGRRTGGSSSIPVEGIKYLFIKGSLRNTSRGSLRGVICTMNCWSGNTLAKYEIYVHRSPTLPGQVFSFDIQTDDDPTVDNVTVDFADSLGREIEVTKK
ncbi:MAG: fibronectin type III domain-containing protein [Dehalococcoidia bacterium]